MVGTCRRGSSRGPPTAEPEFYRNALFLCQQCAEKAIKGFLTFNETAFPKTHSISALTDLVEPLDPDLCDIVQAAQGLTRYAAVMRYPGAPYEPDANETDFSRSRLPNRFLLQ